MLKHFLSILITSFSVISLSAQDSNDQKPDLKLNVSIDGQQFSVNEGETLRFDSKSIIIKSSNYMTFDKEALQFDFPRYFSYQFEQEEGFKNWSLDGNNFIITYFVFDVEVELDPFIKEMVSKFGKKNCKVSDKYLKLGDIKLAGKRINVNLIGEELTYDIFFLETDDNKTHFISFQDSKDDDGADSRESVDTLEIINKTIKKK